MNRLEFSRMVADQHGTKYVDSYHWTLAVFESLADALAVNDSVKIKGIGVFSKVHKKERRRSHPTTGQIFIIPERDELVFHPCHTLKKAVELGVPVSEYIAARKHDEVVLDEDDE